MKALVTGGAGFIGSHLARKLLHEGHLVDVIDDLSTGSIRNIERLKLMPGFRYYLGSIMESQALAELVDGADVIFHMAAAVGVRLIVEEPVRTIETNINGTEALLRVAAKKNRWVFISSSSEVYGKSTRIPFHEDSDLVIGPTSKCRWSYACSKAIDEFLGLAYHREFGLPVTVLRFFNIVGPGQTGRYGMVLPRFASQAIRGEPVTVYGDGTQSRCFLDVEDLVNLLVELPYRTEAVGGVFNIGSDHETSIIDLARLVIARAQSSSTIRLVPYDEAYAEGFEDMYRRVPDLNRITSLTGFRPSHGIDRIVDRVIAYERTRDREFHPAAAGTLPLGPLRESEMAVAAVGGPDRQH